LTIKIQKKKNCHFCGAELKRKYIDGIQRLFCSFCKTPIYENPIPATCVVVLDKDNRLILVKRSVEPKRGMWCLPGGFMELFESPERAALRELKEETNLTGEIDLLLGVRANANPVYGTVLVIGYLIKNFSGDMSPGDDASDIDFFVYDKSMPEAAFDSHDYFIRTVFNNMPLLQQKKELL